MINNIIFDLGNVLLDFYPKEYLQGKGLGSEDLEFIYKEIFLSDEWIELDRGTITREEALKAITARNPDQVELLLSFTDFEEILTPVIPNVAVLKELKNRGYKIYYLTNFHSENFSHVLLNFDFFKSFDGGVVSADVKLIKPDHRIYITLKDKYNLIPEESLFIDDTKENVDAAMELGFNAFHLTEQAALKDLLENYKGPFSC